MTGDAARRPRREHRRLTNGLGTVAPRPAWFGCQSNKASRGRLGSGLASDCNLAATSAALVFPGWEALRQAGEQLVGRYIEGLDEADECTQSYLSPAAFDSADLDGGQLGLTG